MFNTVVANIKNNPQEKIETSDNLRILSPFILRILLKSEYNVYSIYLNKGVN